MLGVEELRPFRWGMMFLGELLKVVIEVVVSEAVAVEALLNITGSPIENGEGKASCLRVG